MTSRGRAAFPGATSVGVGCWLFLATFLLPVADDVAEALLGWTSGLFLTLVYAGLFFASGVAGLRGVGGGRGWVGTTPRVSVLLGAGMVAFFVLAKVVPGPLGMAALLALLFGPPVGLLLLAWRGWRAARSTEGRTGVR